MHATIARKSTKTQTAQALEAQPKESWARSRVAAASLLIGALAILKSSTALAEDANIVVNGDFEMPAVNCGLWLPVPQGSGFITGWHMNVLSTTLDNGGCNSNPGYAHSVDLITSPGGAEVYTGRQSVDLAGTSSTDGDELFQDLSTEAGRKYTLTFHTSSNGGPMENSLTVKWDGVELATLTTPGLGTWEEHTFTVRASSTSTRLEFVEHMNGWSGPLLDSVSVVGSTADEEPPVVSCPPGVTVAFGAVPAAATTTAEFIAAGGSITDNEDPNPVVTSSDEVSGSCPMLVTRTYTVTDASGNAATCQQAITVNNFFADDAIVWFGPSTHNGVTTFNRGSTIPVKVQARSCSGADVTMAANVVGTVEVFVDTACAGNSAGNSLTTICNGSGGACGLMEKSQGYLKYNLNTKSLPRTSGCYLLKVTVTDLNTGESRCESISLRPK